MDKLSQRPTLISLFAGAGGLDLGLEQAGFSTVFACDVDGSACQTLQFNKLIGTFDRKQFQEFFTAVANQRCYSNWNLGHLAHLQVRLAEGAGRHSYLRDALVSQQDLRKLRAEELLQSIGLSRGQVDLLAGGPPCQPFSKAGKRRAVDDPANGDLFMEFARLVDGIRPKWFIFENVKGLTFTDTDVVRILCSDCGCDSVVPFPMRQKWNPNDKMLLSCVTCGGASAKPYIIREGGGSLYIIHNEFERLGYRCEAKILNAADYGAPQFRERLFIIGTRDGYEIRWPRPSHGVMGGKEDQRELLTMDGDNDAAPVIPHRTVYEALWKERGHPLYGKLDREIAVLWVKNVVRPKNEPVTWSLDRPSPTVGAHQAAKLALAPLGVPEEQIFRQQWHTKGRRQGDTPPVHVEHTYLSDEELLRLQTFPPFWYLHGTRMERAFQIGNAVPPELARAVGGAILKAASMESQHGEVVERT